MIRPAVAAIDFQAAIEARGLTKLFGGRIVLNQLDLRVARGHIHGLLGPNGAGKTTFIRLAAGLLSPDDGELRVAGLEPARAFKAVRRRMGYLPENRPLNQDLTVLEHLKLMARLRGLEGGPARAAIKEVLDWFELEASCGRPPKRLSKGAAQRLGLALTFLGRPELLILDEPASGLDPRQAARFKEVLQLLRPRSTIFISSHILPELARICDQASLMVQGRILASDSPEGFSGRFPPFVRVRIEADEPGEVEKALAALAPTRALPGPPGGYELRAAPALAPAIAELVLARRWRLYELTPGRFSLEEAFLRLADPREGDGR